jgi:hypothetical protein
MEVLNHHRKSVKVRAFHHGQEFRGTRSLARKVQVVRKLNGKYSIDDSIEKDFLFEKDDPSLFLKAPVDKYAQMGYLQVKDPFKEMKNNEKTNKNYLKLDQQPQISERTSEFQINFKLRPSANLKEEEDPKKDLDSRIKVINDRIQKFKSLKVPKTFKSDSNFLFRQEKSLKRFDFAKNKWEKIEKGLMLKLKRLPGELLGRKQKEEFENVAERVPNWITTLRSDPVEKKFYEFIPVGNKLSGIFIRDVVSYSPEYRFHSKSCPDLSIAGMSKLPLEISAVQKTGARVLRDLQTGEVEIEEVFAEDYRKEFLKK